MGECAWMALDGTCREKPYTEQLVLDTLKYDDVIGRLDKLIAVSNNKLYSRHCDWSREIEKGDGMEKAVEKRKNERTSAEASRLQRKNAERNARSSLRSNGRSTSSASQSNTEEPKKSKTVVSA